ncbi:hypothetical protein LYSHEL_20470 [Lysobacter helvus]|uniref:DUF3971 domain-containing protein n=2 Tax=Lysobacteraceae TaxID=32033 RepID=A0ABM7Q6Q2_9GAMM|nr:MULTISPECIES: hypothetical protein [Lysobacter]BCT93024.1 hypothetical protein LYSCAS_20480 [Lysobacter caseinilyticus]BCT96176.1 hypothetical protein LYSHEL_20470 [Lysobacter helvus]
MTISLRARRWLLVSAALLLLAVVALHWISRPQRVASLVLSQIGSALGLQITSDGTAEYRLRGGPQLVLREVDARVPGAKTAVLHAKRVSVAVPWSTVRSRGATLAFTRVELDAPVIDVVAMQQWLASLPPSETKMPTLSDGLQVRDGRVVGAGWSVDIDALDVPRWMPERALEATTKGRFVQGTTRVPFALRVDATRPASGAQVTVRGDVSLEQPQRKLVARLNARGPLQLGDGLRIVPLRLSLVSRYTQDKTDLPFVFAMNGPLRVRNGTVALSPAGVALRGDDVVPDFDARAAFAWTNAASLHLDGTLATWPDAWPVLPPPIGQSTSPLPFVLDYAGPFDFSDIARLQLKRDATAVDARFRLPEVLAWIDADATSPLPPLSGTAHTPTLEIGGATLEGVDVRIDDPALDTAAP